MARTNGKKKMNKIVNLKIVVEKLQRSLSMVRRLAAEFDNNKHQHNQPDQNDSSHSVPEDVKEGHFAVIAVDEDELKRFVVPLKCLTHPSFLKLLEQAAEEYGFDHDGALTVPCRPSEFEGILAHEQWLEGNNMDQSRFDDNGVNWSSSMVKSC
ncbi:protein SMALL AUXIN UP-REGULATED RNA 51-like [Lycium ferocissimum]|uniref:protein SMALL AUXIN UP-REGULATED RNA 51-like n=1 Tax=Lycium ferocissimum TaxID=112874 RepID=UPI0028167F4D|nr:protein SMALL AUXIN UP-REGULATED RNA 51-like [Lycium ferocissimum]